MILKPNIPAVPFSGAAGRANRTVGGAGRITCVPNTLGLLSLYSNLFVFTILIGTLAMRSRVTPRTVTAITIAAAANEALIVANAAGNPAALMIQPMTATHSDPTP
jgi:hypothetical protein